MLHTDIALVGCPYCGERVEVVVDHSVGEQCYVEDCPVCCRPMVLTVAVAGDGRADVTAARDDD